MMDEDRPATGAPGSEYYLEACELAAVELREKGFTYTTIAAIFGVTRERARVLEQQGKRRQARERAGLEYRE
jgi:transcriptional regulator